MRMLETLAIVEVLPGMRLAEALRDESGRVLVPDGCELSESVLNSLRRRGIAALTVVRDIEEDPAIRAARRAKLVSLLDHRFRKAGNDPEIRLLYQAILDFQMEHQA